MPEMLLWNVAENRPERVEGSAVADAIASGKYRPGPPEITQGHGPAVTRDVGTIGAAAGQGEVATSGATAFSNKAHREEAAAALRAQMDTGANQASTFIEGAIDALSLGMLHEPGHKADVRRSVFSGTNLAGNILGTVVGLGTPGMVRGTVRAGEELGKAAARAAFGTEKGILARGLTEAGAAAALNTAAAAGHQAWDVVVEDKPFAAEALVDAAKLGGLMGFGGGVLMGGLKGASRAAVKGQGGLVGDTAEVASKLEGGIKAYDDVLEHNEAMLGGLKEMRRAGRLGEVSDDFLKVRAAAVKEARAAQSELAAINVGKALDSEPAEYAAWGKARERYHTAIQDLEGIMKAHPDEVVAVTSPAPQQWKGFATQAEWDAAAAANPRPHYTEGTVSPREPTVFGKAGPAPAAAPGLVELDAAVAKMPVRPPVSPQANAEGFMANLEQRGAVKTVKEDLPAGAAQGAIARDLEANPAPPAAAAPAMDEWMAGGAPRVRAYDEAAAKVRASMDDLYKASGGRMDSARALGLLEKAGVKPSTDPLGPSADAIWSIRRAARLAADESRGVKTALGGGMKHMAALGAMGMGHPLVALAAELIGGSGKMAATAGRLAKSVAGAAEKFLTSTKVRAASVAAGNHAWVYSERGPIEDPLERIQELKYLASNPEAIRQRVLQSMGDLAVVAPEQVRAIQDCAVGKITALSVRAPAIMWDKLGRPLSPPAGKMRDFLEFENAMHDLPGILQSVGDGGASRAQVNALQSGWPAVHQRLVTSLVGDPDVVRNLDRGRLRALELLTGYPLTNASDPQFLLRQASAWQPPEPQQPPGKPQAFNINPAGAPTPSQANATGRAPGN